jgi:hypothetical protein
MEGLMNVNTEAMSKQAGKLPAVAAFGFAIVAAVLAVIIDYVFEAIVHLGGYMWYVATAICFGGAGFGAGLMTKAPKMAAYTAMGIGAALYAVLTIVLYVVVFSGTVGDAIIPAVINFAIALGTGLGGATKGTMQRDQVLAAAAPRPVGM